MKNKKIIMVIVIVIILIIVMGIFVYFKLNNITTAEQESIIAVEELVNKINNDNSWNNGINTNEKEFDILEIRKIDEEKLLEKGIELEKENLYKTRIEINENGEYEVINDYNNDLDSAIFAIKYRYGDDIEIIIYVGDDEYNSTVLEDLGIGSWIRDIWNEDIFTNDKIRVEKVMKQINKD